MVLFESWWLLMLPYSHALTSADFDRACYFPDGSYAGGHVPCLNNTSANSGCCKEGFACLTNGVCQATGDLLKQPNATKFVRGACTDQKWASSACPLFCNVQNNDVLSGDQPMASCLDTRPHDIYFCINKVNKALGLDNCDSGENLIFFKGNPEVITTIGSTPTPSTPAPSSTSTTHTSASTTSQSTSQTPASSPAPSQATTETQVEVEAEAAAGAKKRAVIGGAIGGVVGGIAIICLLVWLILWRRRKQQGQPKRASLFKNPADDKALEAPGWVPLKDLPGQVHEMPAWVPDDDKSVNVVHEAPGWSPYHGEPGADSFGQRQHVYEVP